VGVVALIALGAPGAAVADGGGGMSAPAHSLAGGGASYGAPVAPHFRATPNVVRSPALPRIELRVDQPGSATVRARVVFLPLGEGAIVRVDLGRVRTGARVVAPWPAGSELAPGRYLVRLHVRGRGGAVLARSARSSGRTTVVVRAPAPAVVVPAPAPVPAPGPAAQSSPGPGVFPIAGPHRYGDGFGAPRPGYRHQGQDMPAATGTPVVAPVPGTIMHVDYQAAGAGWYVVERGIDGRDYFFCHCQSGSVPVVPGQAVVAGQKLCGVGSTGASSGPHLHFEIWVGGWRAGPQSAPVDPLADLRAWDVPGLGALPAPALP